MATFPLDEKRARLEAEQARLLIEILRENPDADLRQARGSTPGGDGRRLRGIPAIGRGCSGAIRGSDPLFETIRRDQRDRRGT